MTEDSRGPVRASSEEDDLGHGRDDAAEEASDPAPGAADDRDDTPEPGGAVGLKKGPEGQGVADRLVAGFAPPDSYTRDTDIPAPPPATAFDQPMPVEQPMPGVQGPGEAPRQEVVADGVVQDGPVPLGHEQGRGRPGFVPHGYEPHDPRLANQPPGSPQPPPGGQGTPYGWPPQQSHQPPPGGRMPTGPQAVPMGAPPGTRPMPPGGPGGPGMPPGGPNWAPVPGLPSTSRGGPGLGVMAVIALVVALVAGGLGAGIGVVATGDGNEPGGISLGGDNSGQANNRPPDSVAGVAQKVLPSVVSIRVRQSGGEGVGGSGFIVNGGFIITNNHVVAAGEGGDIQVVFNDKKAVPATVKGRDPSSDIAVLQPQGAHSLPALTAGNSEQLAVGDPVIAIGSPLGLQGSVTTGIISSMNRAVPTGGEGGESSFLNAIQTDAAINPGNSGGPLVDAKGRVIGINTAIATLGSGGLGGQSQSGSIGLGFAIPINQGRRVAESIINTGTVKQARIGVIPDPQYQGGGARIMDSAPQGQEPVTPNGPAARAGLKPGDIITKVDNRPIEDATDLIALIRSKAPGDRVRVTYERAGKESTVDVTLEAG